MQEILHKFGMVGFLQDSYACILLQNIDSLLETEV